MVSLSSCLKCWFSSGKLPPTPARCISSQLGMPFMVMALAKWITVHPELYAKPVRRTSEPYVFIYFIFKAYISLVILRIRTQTFQYLKLPYTHPPFFLAGASHSAYPQKLIISQSPQARTFCVLLGLCL